MKGLLKNKYATAALIAALVIMIWQGVRIQRSKNAAALLGMLDYDYASDTTDRYNAANWDNYETGSGVPPWSK